MNPEEILADARAASPKVRIEDYRETVVTLREKGYSWREIADFLKERGVEIDHTRIYRMFGKTNKQRRKESRAIEIAKITFMGVRKTKKNNLWNIMEFQLPSKLGGNITVVGYAWGKDGVNYELNDDDSMIHQNATLIIKSGEGFPISYVKLEFKVEGEQWAAQEVYIMPKWEVLI